MKLESLRRKSAYFHEGPQWVRNRWPRIQSLSWFIKAHKDELTKKGAIVKLGREWFIDIDAFPDEIVAMSGLPDEGAGNLLTGQVTS